LPDSFEEETETEAETESETESESSGSGSGGETEKPKPSEDMITLAEIIGHAKDIKVIAEKFYTVVRVRISGKR